MRRWLRWYWDVRVVCVYSEYASFMPYSELDLPDGGYDLRLSASLEVVITEQ